MKPLRSMRLVALRISLFSLSFLLLNLILNDLSAQGAHAPFSMEDLLRLQRLRPAAPYDEDGGYRLISAWTEIARADSAPPKPSLWGDLALGKIFQIAPRWEFGVDGLVNLVAGSNPYDGLLGSYELIAAYNPRPGYRLVLRSAHRYAFKRERYQTDNHALYFYNPQRAGLVALSLGRTTYGTSHVTNEEEFAETYITDLGGINNINSVERDYLTLRNAIYLTKALRSSAEVRYERRRDLDNIVTQAVSSLHAEARLSYDFSPYGASSRMFPTPYKLPRGFFAPELGLVYRLHYYLPQQNSGIQRAQASHQLELNLRMAYAFSAFQRIDWAIVGETVLSGATALQGSDYRYLPMGEIDRRHISATWTTGRFNALDRGSWLWSRVNYGGGRMLFSSIPIFKRLGVDEYIHARAMIATSGRHWAELGYSVGLGEMLRLGAFYGADFKGRDEWAFRISVPLLFLSSRASTRY